MIASVQSIRSGNRREGTAGKIPANSTANTMNEPGWYWYRGHETGGEWEPVKIELRGELWCNTLDLPASKLHGERERTYPPESSREEYQDTDFCTHCDDETPHLVFDSGHERDSSHDWRKCLKCGWRWSGMTGRYEPDGPSP